MFALVLILHPTSTNDLLLTYAIRESQRCFPGMLFSVKVRGRTETALVLRLQKEVRGDYTVFELGEAIYPEPAVSRRGMALARWLARYYVCALGRALSLFLPPPVRPRREIRYYRPDFSAETMTENAGEAAMETAAEAAMGSMAEGAARSETESAADKAVGRAAESTAEKEAGMPALFADPARQALLAEAEKTRLLRQALLDGIIRAGRAGMARERIRARWGAPALAQADAMAAEGLLRKEEELRRGRRGPRKEAAAAMTADRVTALSADQQRAWDRIAEDIRGGAGGRHLLFGVTGSGKTEVYLRLAVLAGELGRQTVYLVPEIGLVPQLVAKAGHWFGPRVAILHSNLTVGQRYAEWQRIRSGEVRLIIGPRSALFAPVSSLGLIIIDEEHEHTYKQAEPEPRYDARRTAEACARLWGATVVRGSATPDLESLYRAENKEIHLSLLPDRVQARPMPPIQWIDMRREMKEGHAHPVSRPLLAALRDRKAKGEQAILLMNRRGFHPYVLCRDCGKTLECPRCSIPLTYHRVGGVGKGADSGGGGGIAHRLICHYCGYQSGLRGDCPYCGSAMLQFMGTGTQRVMDYLAGEMPELRALRLDVDSTARAGSHGEILRAFQEGKADVLVGTQMVAKGFDFPRVTLSAVLHIDGVINLPDYQGSERALQLILQTAGRAGRGEIPGAVMVQTFYPDNPVFRLAETYDYMAFYRSELALRRMLDYPPLKKSARILVSGADEERVEAALEELAAYCRRNLPPEDAKAMTWLGPVSAPLEKVNNRWRRHLVLLSDKWAPLARCLRLARARGAAWGDEPRLILDMEPKSFM